MKRKYDNDDKVLFVKRQKNENMSELFLKNNDEDATSTFAPYGDSGVLKCGALTANTLCFFFMSDKHCVLSEQNKNSLITVTKKLLSFGRKALIPSITIVPLIWDYITNGFTFQKIVDCSLNWLLASNMESKTTGNTTSSQSHPKTQAQSWCTRVYKNIIDLDFNNNMKMKSLSGSITTPTLKELYYALCDSTYGINIEKDYLDFPELDIVDDRRIDKLCKVYKELNSVSYEFGTFLIYLCRSSFSKDENTDIQLLYKVCDKITESIKHDDYKKAVVKFSQHDNRVEGCIINARNSIDIAEEMLNTKELFPETNDNVEQYKYAALLLLTRARRNLQ